MKNLLKKECHQFKILLRSVPATVMTLFVISVFAMNLLANKSINLPWNWLALDCGIIVSWVTFLAMDIITKHFGPKAATQISLLAIGLNLLFCLIFFVASKISGTWGEAFVTDGISEVVNDALDKTVGGTWYVVMGSSVAFIVAAIVNNFSNWGIGKLFKKNPDGAVPYFIRTYVSTAIGQFADNLTFALIVSHFFFGWSILQCVTCALTGMFAELLFEVAFSYFGFRICKKWKAEDVGKEYFECLQEE